MQNLPIVIPSNCVHQLSIYQMLEIYLSSQNCKNLHQKRNRQDEPFFFQKCTHQIIEKVQPSGVWKVISWQAERCMQQVAVISVRLDMTIGRQSGGVCSLKSPVNLISLDHSIHYEINFGKWEIVVNPHRISGFAAYISHCFCCLMLSQGQTHGKVNSTALLPETIICPGHLKVVHLKSPLPLPQVSV